MKKKLNVVICDKPIVLDMKECIEVENDMNIKEIHSGYYELVGTLPKPEFSDKPFIFPESVDSRVGRIGYIKVCEEGEELRKPEFEIIEYETDNSC